MTDFPSPTGKALLWMKIMRMAALGLEARPIPAQAHTGRGGRALYLGRGRRLDGRWEGAAFRDTRGSSVGNPGSMASRPLHRGGGDHAALSFSERNCPAIVSAQLPQYQEFWIWVPARVCGGRNHVFTIALQADPAYSER